MEIPSGAARSNLTPVGALLAAAFGVVTLAVAAVSSSFHDAGERQVLLSGFVAIALYGAVTGYFAFRVGHRTGALTDHAPLILRELDVGVVKADKDFRIVYANPAFANMIGRASDKLRGLSVRDTIFVDDRQVFSTATARRRAGVSDSYRVRLEGPSGKPVHTVISAWPTYSRGRFTGSVALIRDVTETISARAEASEARNLSGFLFDALTHDLSNSLQLVMGRAAAAASLARVGSPEAAQVAVSAQAAAERSAKELREIKQVVLAETEDWPLHALRAGELVERAITTADVDVDVAVITDMDARAALSEVHASAIGSLALSKLIEEAAAKGNPKAPHAVTVELRHGELGPSTVVARVRGCDATLPVEDVMAAMRSAANAPLGGTPWRSGVRLILAATVARPHGWTLSALRDEGGAGTVFELRMPVSAALPPSALVGKRAAAKRR